MRLLQARLTHVGPFEDVAISLTDDHGDPRPVTVIHGGAGVPFLVFVTLVVFVTFLSPFLTVVLRVTTVDRRGV